MEPGDRVATLAWNTARHMEVWYGAMGMGAVCHTLNPRLFPEQLIYIINHAGDRILFADMTFAPLLKAILPKCPSVERVVILTDDDTLRAAGLEGVQAYEAVLQEARGSSAWGGFDENTACALCYTSGTTGDPKGVLYSHRSNFLHTLMGLQTTVLGADPQAVVLPIVPMFHANAWGIAFAAPAGGAKLVMPGACMDGAAIHELIETEGVTFSGAVPTVWQGLLTYLRANNLGLSTLKRVVIGGSAVPESMIRAFHDDYGVEVVQGWGMTETSPIGSLSNSRPEISDLSFEEQLRWRAKQGAPPLGVELVIKDEQGKVLPADGRSQGRLMVRGAAVAAGYFGQASRRRPDRSRRRAASALGRAPSADRQAEARRRPGRGLAPRLSGRKDRPMVDARCGSVRRRHSAGADRQGRQEVAAGSAGQPSHPGDLSFKHRVLHFASKT